MAARPWWTLTATSSADGAVRDRKVDEGHVADGAERLRSVQRERPEPRPRSRGQHHRHQAAAHGRPSSHCVVRTADRSGMIGR